jgi:type IV pilus assembly protein PilB
VRVVCPKCKQPHKPREQELLAAGITPEQAASANFMKGRGCNHCGNSGYRGRLGIFELMTMSSKIRELAFQGANTQDLRKEAIKNGMSTLYDDGIRKVLEGITTVEEVFRVAKKVEN